VHTPESTERAALRRNHALPPRPPTAAPSLQHGVRPPTRTFAWRCGCGCAQGKPTALGLTAPEPGNQRHRQANGATRRRFNERGEVIAEFPVTDKPGNRTLYLTPSGAREAFISVLDRARAEGRGIS
jgi:hypothetical protein